MDSSPSPDDLTAFKKLFWEARKAHRMAGKKASADDPAHQVALGFAKEHGWDDWAVPFLEALRLAYAGLHAKALALIRPVQVPANFEGERFFVEGLAHHGFQNFDAAIECYQKALDSPGFGAGGEVWNGMGNSYRGKKDFDTAIECYQKALDSTGYGSPGIAWNNMGLTYRDKKDFDTAMGCFRKALDFPSYEFPEHSWYNMGLTSNDEEDFDTAIDCYRKALDSPGLETRGDAWYNMGFAYSGKEDFEASIDCYRKALDSPDYDTPGSAWCNMGVAYDEKEDFDTAIDCYRKALDSPDYDTPGSAWYNMGVAYGKKKDFDTAIDYYRKALDSPGYNIPGRAWNNMGVAYGDKKDFDTAIDCYRKALDSPGYDTPHNARLNLSTALRDAGRLDEAEKEIRHVLSEPDTEGGHSRAHRLLALLEDRRENIPLNPQDEALTAPAPPTLQDGPEAGMKETLDKAKSQYETYMQRQVDSHPDDLTILRGWSSSVTLLEGGTDCQWQGGGYFLKWRGKGIVIDPGFDFLDNFHEAGFHAREVQAVLVSHNHPDHNSDLTSLDDLLYEIHRTSDPALTKTFFALDEDTAAHALLQKARHRGWAEKLRPSEDPEDWIDRKSEIGLTLEHFKVEHGADVPCARGLRLRLHHPAGSDKEDFILGYTADGKFTDSLVNNLEGCDVLIAHVSQPDIREFNDSDFLKSVHLGYNGVIKLLKGLKAKPKIILIGEFWAGLADLRLPLIQGIRQRSGVDAVFPACLGLSLRLPDLTIRCTHCKAQVPASQVRIAPPVRPFGVLGYLCQKCML